MKIFISCLYICIFMFLYGCNYKRPLDGIATPPRFNHGPYIFERIGKNIVIESKNAGFWRFEGVTINDIVSSDHKLVKPKYPVKLYDKNDGRNETLVGDWFSIEKLDKRHILINMGENKTGEDIHIRVHIFAGNAMEKDIEIEQKAE